ncbi:PHP domain-containing protein [Actinotignum urinale]|uniref:PHP domain-containing protein n=1 Tax=Actinotignum urinale TaxID=190146 RepID=UPI000C80EBB8|nr:PHP domain-containing protein [Actinotignum urinale]WIK58696.1 PHP domain-containing protein [Actinotignum urinale]
MRIDTHVHSTASDSTLTPSQLMWHARESGLGAIAITDHDTMNGWEEAASLVEKTGVGLIRGIEMSSKYLGITTHILGYLYDPENAQIVEHCNSVRKSRFTRTYAMVELLSKDYPIGWEDVKEVAEDGATLGRPHIADALVAKGITSNRSEAFQHILHPRSPYYVEHYAPNTLDVVRWITEAGGRAVFAHPVAPHRNKVVPWELFGMLRDAGLWGVEIYHRDNALDLAEKLKVEARELGLEIFGSSDYHGSGKPNLLGENTTEFEVVQRMEEGAFLPILWP